VDDGLRVTPSLSIPLSEIELRTSRSSGPGGQHANVTESRVEAAFEVAASSSLSDAQRTRLEEQLGSRVTAVAQDARSQARNRELALERLAAKLAAGLEVPTQRRATRPSRTARKKRIESKRRRSQPTRLRRPPEADQ
jgi:ribosome-associated protein